MIEKKATVKPAVAKSPVASAAKPVAAAKKIAPVKKAAEKKIAAAKKAAAKKVAPVKKAGAVKDIALLAKGPIPMTFVKKNNGAWNHEAWLGFLENIKSKGYQCDTDEVGLLLEQKKEEYWSK